MPLSPGYGTGISEFLDEDPETIDDLFQVDVPKPFLCNEHDSNRQGESWVIFDNTSL